MESSKLSVPMRLHVSGELFLTHFVLKRSCIQRSMFFLSLHPPSFWVFSFSFYHYLWFCFAFLPCFFGLLLLFKVQCVVELASITAKFYDFYGLSILGQKLGMLVNLLILTHCWELVSLGMFMVGCKYHL